MVGAANAHLGGICIENAFVVRFSVRGEKFNDFGIDLKAVILAGLHCHADTAIGLKRTLEGLIGLEADDGFLVFVKIPRAMRREG